MMQYPHKWELIRNKNKDLSSWAVTMKPTSGDISVIIFTISSLIPSHLTRSEYSDNWENFSPTEDDRATFEMLYPGNLARFNSLRCF